MTNRLIRAAAQQAGKHAQKRGWLDVRYGFQLMRSREVPASKKLLALGIGGAMTAALIAMEVPLEGVIGVLLPFIGAGIDMAIDGAEVVLLPMLIASVVLTWL